MGIELVSQVNDIPKGSRLAVSTNLLASLIAVCMRATGQTAALTGPLDEAERRIVAARAILGEWLGGSGGGWQDSGGVWPGMKLIQGAEARAGDPEFGVSRGRLLPDHTIFGRDDVTAETRQQLAGEPGAGPRRHGPGRGADPGDGDGEVSAARRGRVGGPPGGHRDSTTRSSSLLRAGDVRAIGAATERNFRGPIQTIIPWATNLYTETLIERVRAEFGDDFWGFWMLGGMAGGGMGFIFDPAAAARGPGRACRRSWPRPSASWRRALPFAMEPVVYDFAINEQGTRGRAAAAATTRSCRRATTR